MDNIYDSVILGGGPAGYTAALYAARSGLDTLIIERLSAGGQMALTGIVENYPGFEEGIDGFTLGMKMQQGAERFGAETRYSEVLSVDFTEKIKRIEVSDGEILSKTVIIAPGANPRELGIESETRLTGKGVHYCAHCDGRFYRDKTVAVVGGGNSAVSDALYLSRIAKKVYLIHRRDTLRAERIYNNQLNNSENIEIIWNSRVEEFIADDRIKAVRIKNVNDGHTDDIECDGVFISIGRKPATEFLKGKVELDKNGYVISDETTKTSAEGVFAAGDVRTKELRQIVTAAADGAVAAFQAERYLN